MNGPPPGVYLTSYLAPLLPLLQRPDVTDIYVNRPGEIWAETLGGQIEQHWAADLSEAVLERLARQIAAISHQGVNREHPLLSASLPGGERIQIIVPPAARHGVALAVRRPLSAGLRLDDYAAAGAFESLSADTRADQPKLAARLRTHLQEGAFTRLLSEAVKGRLNVLISGGTSTGKTTFLNALIQEIPPEERLIFLEDTPELHTAHANTVSLIASRSAIGETLVSAEDLLSASLRMRPDRILLGELRGPEAFTFLRAINTGHPGSMTTIHADTPERAIEQLVLLVLQSGARLRREDIIHYVRSTIDVYVQLSRQGGRRRITEVRLSEALAQPLPCP